MKNVIVVVLTLVVVFYTGAQVLTMFRAKSDFGDRMERALDFVDDASINSVTQELVADAKKLGIELTANDIHVTYADTDIQSYAQQVVGQRLGAQYKNKRVVITAHYTAYVDGLPVSQEIEKYKIRQVERPQMPANKALQELDSQ